MKPPRAHAGDLRVCSPDSGGVAADALPLVKGTLDVLVLKALAWAPMHGFEITSWLEARSGGALEVQDSALYQALHRLEARGLAAAEWGGRPTTSGRATTSSPRPARR